MPAAAPVLPQCNTQCNCDYVSVLKFLCLNKAFVIRVKGHMRCYLDFDFTIILKGGF